MFKRLLNLFKPQREALDTLNLTKKKPVTTYDIVKETLGNGTIRYAVLRYGKKQHITKRDGKIISFSSSYPEFYRPKFQTDVPQPVYTVVTSVDNCEELCEFIKDEERRAKERDHAIKMSSVVSTEIINCCTERHDD